ncbi:MAG TPA: trehalose-phosphatase [Methylibium sp.]|nr:trehalose-phosphatase [Methylibium sp.]
MTDDLLAPPGLDERDALFLDFDGTLAAIAPRPDAVVVADWVVPALTRAQTWLGGAVAVVSGRPLAELDALLAPLRLPAVGVHGVERRDAAGRVRVLAGAPPEDLIHCAERLAARHEGLLVERKPSALALHYRARPELAELCAQALLAAARPHHGTWAVQLGKCVVEVKPRRASKGEAVRDFLAMPDFAGRRPVFVGDDATDEDGFAAVQAAGGCGVKVGPGPSGARCRLADPAAVRDWLLAALHPLAPDEASAPLRALAAAALGGLV